MDKRTIIHTAIVMISAIALGACESSKAILDTAKTTAANVSLVNTSLETFKERSMRSAQNRRMYIASVAETARDLDLEYQYRLSAKRLTEDGKARRAGNTPSAFAESIVAHLDDGRERYRKAKEREQQLDEELKTAYAELTLPSEQMKLLAKTLAELGKERSLKDQVDAFRAFFKEVSKTYSESMAAAESSIGQADSSAETLGNVPSDSSP